MTEKTELVIFTHCFDLLAWLLPQVERFPKSQRFVITQRLLAAAMDLQEALYEANAHHGAARLLRLQAADADLDKLRLYLRLAHRLGWLGSGPYEHGSRMVAGVGRLLGGWLRQTRSAPPRQADPS